VVTAVGSVPDGGSSGLAPSTILLLAWNPVTQHWIVAFDASKDPSYQSNTQQGEGPGLVDDPGGQGPQVAVVHDQPQSSDLLYWLDSVGGNSGALHIGVVRYMHGLANLVYANTFDEGHIGPSDGLPTTQSGVSVIATAPHQQIQVTAPWLTDADSRSHAARMYSVTLARVDSDGSYRVVADSRPYLGVGTAIAAGTTGPTVRFVEPGSPAASVLMVGDILKDVSGSALSTAPEGLNGPIVVDQIAVLHPGDSVSLEILRHGNPTTVRIKLGQWSLAGADDIGRLMLVPM
jgi:hypothetical protein